MEEKVLLLPGANGTELTRMLARFNKNSLGLRIMNATEFARFALMRSGIALNEGFLPRKQESAVIDSFVRGIEYFASAAYADSEKIADALYGLRCLIPDNEYEAIHNILPKGKFADKNESIVEVYDKYLASLKGADNIDTIGLIRKAIAQANPLSCPVYTFKEYPLTPLENELARRLSVERIDSSLCEFLEVEPQELHGIDYTKSYGASNEVEAIYDYIMANNLPFDECVVAVADTVQYGQLFYEFAQCHNLPISLGCGVPIMNSNPARLLKLLYAWDNVGYNGVDALSEVLCSDALDQEKLYADLGITKKLRDEVIEAAGQLRLSFNRAENDRKIDALPTDIYNEEIYNALKALSDELAMGEINFVKKYARIRKDVSGRVDCSARSVICDALEAYSKYTGGESLNNIIPEILSKSVCAENSREGALFVTGLQGALSAMRKHLFVAGMSASNFPGNPRENYLLLDCDYFMLADVDIAPTSVNLVRRKKAGLDDLMALACALDVNVHLSYSEYNLAEMKGENPSSALFEIFKQQQGDDVTLDQYENAFKAVGYFQQQVSDDYQVGLAYVEGKDIGYDEVKPADAVCTHDRAFSPTAIEKYFECPYRFFLTKIMGVKETEEDDPFVVIDHLQFGNLAHKLMKGLADSYCDLDAFLKRADAAFDDFLQCRPPIHPEAAAKEKRVFLDMMKTAYETDPNNTVVVSEEKLECTHSSGIRLAGYPDRVEQISDNEYIIADYKTGKKISHKEDDIDTCLQTVIYAYMLETQGKTISSCKYRYLRNGITITCNYNADMKDKLNEKLKEFKNSLDTGDFRAEKKDACKYCKVKSICDEQLFAEEDE